MGEQTRQNANEEEKRAYLNRFHKGETVVDPELKKTLDEAQRLAEERSGHSENQQMVQ